MLRCSLWGWNREVVGQKLPWEAWIQSRGDPRHDQSQT